VLALSDAEPPSTFVVALLHDVKATIVAIAITAKMFFFISVFYLLLISLHLSFIAHDVHPECSSKHNAPRISLSCSITQCIPLSRIALLS
jgi:hypothetical protein